MTALQDALHAAPTATTVPSLRAVTARRPTPLGVVRRLQLVPFQRSVKLPPAPSPTAQMLLAETAATPLNRLLPWFAANGSTLGTKLQLVPSQCAIASFSSGCSPLLDPTAQTLVGESAAAASARSADGAGTWLQVWPFQCRIVGPATAQTSLLESADMPRMKPTLVKAGLETTLQLLPSQCSIKIPKLLTDPAAQTSFDATTVTVLRKAPCPTLGLETTLQLVPSQCSINVV